MSTPRTTPNGQTADGNMLFSSQDVTLAEGVFFAKNIKMSHPSKRIEGTNSAGVVVRKGHVKRGYADGSMQLKYPSAGPAVPAQHQLFTLVDAGGNTVHVILENVDATESEDAEAMLDCTFSQNINYSGS